MQILVNSKRNTAVEETNIKKFPPTVAELADNDEENSESNDIYFSFSGLICTNWNFIRNS